MVKDELTNIKALLKTRIKNDSRYMPWLYIGFGFAFLATFSGMIFAILDTNDTAFHNNVLDYSTTPFIFIPIGLIISGILYRKYNARLSVFPQSNTSRLVSSIIYNYYIVVVVYLVILCTYLLHYGLTLLISIFMDGIYFALNFDIGFVIAGFFVCLIYSLLILSVTDLISAIIRKWSYYAIITLTSLFTLLMVNIQTVFEYLPRVLSFLIFESSLILFFIKAVGVWLAITALTLIVNYYTVYNKSQNQVLKKRIVIICTVIAVLIILVTPGIIMLSVNTGYENSPVIAYNEASTPADFNTRPFEETRIDISHLRDTTGRINIEGENLIIPEMTNGYLQFRLGRYATVFGISNLTNLNHDTLIIQYHPPSLIINGIDTLEHANPRMDAYLEGDTLHLNYTFDDITTIILQIWSIVRQFDIFKDKGVYTPASPFWNYSESASAQIDIIGE